jgi:hypothetical protein
MVETEKYELHYVSAALGIDEKRYYYPKEEEYLEVFWTESPVFATPTPAPCGAPVYSANAIPNTTGGIDYMDLRVNYSDCSAQTSNMTFYVTDVSNNKVKRTLFTNATVTPNSFNLSYVVPATQGSAYKFGVNGRTFFGSQIYQETLITINQSQWRANFLNADDGDAAATWIYNAVAIALVSLLGYLFGKISMKAGVVVVPLIMAVFSWMGWLQTSALIVSVAVVLGVMFYLRYAEQEAGL